MTFYTAKGDDGTTGLLGEGRVPKYHARIEAVGALDEASAALGLARAQCSAPQAAPILLEAQRDLYKLMAEVAATPENAERFHFINGARVGWLEKQTDELSVIVEMPNGGPDSTKKAWPYLAIGAIFSVACVLIAAWVMEKANSGSASRGKKRASSASSPAVGSPARQRAR